MPADITDRDAKAAREPPICAAAWSRPESAQAMHERVI